MFSGVGQFEAMSGFFFIKFFIERYSKDLTDNDTLLQNENSSRTIRSLILSLRGKAVALPISFVLVRRLPIVSFDLMPQRKMK